MRDQLPLVGSLIVSIFNVEQVSLNKERISIKLLTNNIPKKTSLSKQPDMYDLILTIILTISNEEIFYKDFLENLEVNASKFIENHE